MVKGFEVFMGLSLGDFVLHVQIQLLQHHLFGIWIVLQIRAGFPDPAYFLIWFLSLPFTVCVTLDLLAILSFEFLIYEMGPVRIPYLRTYYENRKKYMLRAPFPVPGVDTMRAFLVPLKVIITLIIFKEIMLCWAW